MEHEPYVPADGQRSPTEEMNPYLPTSSDCDAIASPACRASRTFLEAALIGLGMSFIAPSCNATYCDLILEMPFSTTIWGMLTGMIPIAIFYVILAIGCSVLCLQPVSRVLSRHQTVIPLAAISLLFSIYFSMLGFGYVRGSISILGYNASYYALAPALIAGFGALTHITVRPRHSNIQQTTGGEPWVSG